MTDRFLTLEIWRLVPPKLLPALGIEHGPGSFAPQGKDGAIGPSARRRLVGRSGSGRLLGPPGKSPGYLLWLGEQLGFESVQDWYRITTDNVKLHRGGGVLKYAWNSSIIAGVRDCFPEYDWKDWLFGMCPRTFWSNRKNHRLYMNWLGQRLGIPRPEDWYNVTNEDFIKNKGGAFLLHYNCTISAAVMAHLPDYDWKEWLFRKIPKGFWQLKRNRRRYLKWLAERLGITRMEGWYHLTRRHFEENCGNNLLKQFAGSPCLLLKDAFPLSLEGMDVPPRAVGLLEEPGKPPEIHGMAWQAPGLQDAGGLVSNPPGGFPAKLRRRSFGVAVLLQRAARGAPPAFDWDKETLAIHRQ